ncbi:MAG: DUF86 domain-containing protein [Clostridia bacterium]|nr:DUF86 domain-containing protein [Clostridia bacterium]
MNRTDAQRIKKIVSTWEALCREIEKHGITEALLLNDEFSQWAVTTPLYNIGEQVYHISPELKQAHPEIPWNVVSGLRHRLVHNYEGINWSIIVEIVFREMDVFVKSIEELQVQG